MQQPKDGQEMGFRRVKGRSCFKNGALGLERRLGGKVIVMSA